MQPYNYKDLEPHIDEETMRIHYEKHHEAYTANLNKAFVEMAAAGLRPFFLLLLGMDSESIEESVQ